MERAQQNAYQMGVHIGATWQKQLNDCAWRLNGSAAMGDDAACSQITLGNLVPIVGVDRRCLG